MLHGAHGVEHPCNPLASHCRQAKEWDAKLAGLERQHLADKERWRREVAARVKETRLQMAQLAGAASREGSDLGVAGMPRMDRSPGGSCRAVALAPALQPCAALNPCTAPPPHCPPAHPGPADQHLEGTTKRAIQENESMASELAYHSAQSARLMAANAQLRSEAADARRDTAIAQRTGAGAGGQW